VQTQSAQLQLEGLLALMHQHSVQHCMTSACLLPLFGSTRHVVECLSHHEPDVYQPQVLYLQRLACLHLQKRYSNWRSGPAHALHVDMHSGITSRR
jgi:hypothetical protein